jgi:hypothetical protein
MVNFLSIDTHIFSLGAFTYTTGYKYQILVYNFKHFWQLITILFVVNQK